MRIGIDMDGVIFDSEKDFRIQSELYDMLELKRNSKKNEEELKFKDRFDWTEEEATNFLIKYHRKIVESANFMPGAKKVLKMLKDEGHQLIVVTARGFFEEETIEITEKILKENDMQIFDKYYWKTSDKAAVCVQENIDIMIDDLYQNCEKIADAKIKTIYLKDAPSRKFEGNEFVKTLYNWGEIYRYIEEIK